MKKLLSLMFVLITLATFAQKRKLTILDHKSSSSLGWEIVKYEDKTDGKKRKFLLQE